MACITRYLDHNGYPPTIREIAREVGIKSPNGVARWLDRLEAEGLITRRKGRARAIIINERGGSRVQGVG